MVPNNLHCSTGHYVIHRIRHHDSFAKSLEAAKLCSSEKGAKIELNLLPNISITEEAQDNGHTVIFEAIRRPDFKHQVTLACIVGHYQELFNELQSEVKPSHCQWEVACQSTTPHCRKTVERRAAEEKVRLCHRPEDINSPSTEGRRYALLQRPNKEPSHNERARMLEGICNRSDYLHD
ncbi:hypothetical protein CI238_10235 [Colletotrichum incanum]|uniref:Uncharacterized protein n=1 Tax=Colletotrichum incanum TaxID=1573173 RepID=A0A166ZN78_COLIC|nr:hypothetical protein CI238_10235 [Colletotrichum incanum]